MNQVSGVSFTGCQSSSGNKTLEHIFNAGATATGLATTGFLWKHTVGKSIKIANNSSSDFKHEYKGVFGKVVKYFEKIGEKVVNKIQPLKEAIEAYAEKYYNHLGEDGLAYNMKRCKGIVAITAFAASVAFATILGGVCRAVQINSK